MSVLHRVTAVSSTDGFQYSVVYGMFLLPELHCCVFLLYGLKHIFTSQKHCICK